MPVMRVSRDWMRRAVLAVRGVCRRIASAHHDQRGTISLLSTFAVLMFTMLLLLITNVAQQVDDKVRMQNAADSAVYSGGVVLARGMNAIAFANHLECDMFGLVAFLREARDQNALQLVPDILERWRRVGAKFAPAQFEKFIPLTLAIPDKTLREERLVRAWSELAASASDFALPVFEQILGTPETNGPANDHLLPNFQRDVLRTIPTLAQEVTNEIALRHGVRSNRTVDVGPTLRNNPQSAANGRGPQYGVLWRTSVQPVGFGDETDPQTRTLPVVDPDPSQRDYYAVPNGARYLQSSRQQREGLARHYLDRWIEDDNLMRGLGFFDDEAQMSQFQELFRIAACGQLERLLNVEFPTTNVPMLLRRDFGQGPTDNQVLDDDYTFVGLAYRAHGNEMAPQMYRNPLDQRSDAVTFAQIALFIPRPLFVYHGTWFWTEIHRSVVNGEVTGESRYYYHYTNGWPAAWGMFSQNWMVKLVPATHDRLPEILQTNPGSYGFSGAVRPPQLGGATMQQIDAVNTH